MKKNYYNENISKNENNLNNSPSNFHNKTTNVNVLLNRVRLEKKKTFNKRILFSLFLISSLILLAFFLAI